MLLGGRRVRVAFARRPGDPCRVATADSGAEPLVATLRRLLTGRTPDELVVVHPVAWTPARAVAEVGGFGRSVSPCPSALALARELAVRTTAPPGPLAIVEVDRPTVAVTLLAGLTDHRVLAAGRGASDAVETVLRRAARAAGIRVPRWTGGVVVTGSGPGALVERIGNLAGRTPVLLDDAEVISALGGLRPSRPAEAAPDFRPVGPLERACDDGFGRGLLGARPRPRRVRAVRQACGPVLWGLVSASLVGALSATSSRPVPAPLSPGVVAQYDYTVTLPAGWQHSGGRPELRRTLLTPAAAPKGSDVISVEQTMLGYDSAAEPDRALREFTERYRAAVAAGDRLDRFTLSERVGGRDVLGYRQQQPARGTEVQWYVLFAGDVQLSIGCQHTPAGTAAVRAACAAVVGSVRSTR